MKKVSSSVFIIFLCCAGVLNAQTVTIKSGQKLQTVTSNKIKMVIEGFGQNIELTNILTADIEAKSMSDTGYLFLNTLKRMQTKSNAMGQSIDLDSERPADLEGQAGIMLKNELGATTQYHVKKNGIVSSIVKEKPGAEPSMSETFSALFGEGQTYPLLLILPRRSVKEGDSWVDSTGTDSMKTVTTYNVKAITGSDYLISMNAVMSAHMPMKQQGMEIIMDLKGTTVSNAVFEKATCLLRSSTGLTETKGTIGVMGQSSPITLVNTTSMDVKKL